MPSFDIVCELDRHEVSNAVDQANKDVGNRFDFKGVDAKFDLSKDTIKLSAETDFQLKQMMEVLCAKLAKRNVDVGHLEVADPVVQYKSASQEVTLKQGIGSDDAKKIVKIIKDKKFKVQASIQGEQIRVTGKKRDDLQEVIGYLRGESVGLPIQFGNFRD